MTISSRHHYIPEFLIKGFVGEDKKVAIFNLEKGRLEPLRKSPKQIFFEWNRNTFEVNGEETDFVEELHQFGENQFAPIYKKIIEQEGPIQLDVEELFALILFINVTHWRVPHSDKDANQIISKSTNQNLSFIIHNKDHKDAPPELYNRVVNEPAFIESARIILAIRDYMNLDMKKSLNNWQIYYASTKVQLHLLGDNPVIQRNESGTNILQNEIIFPLSKGKTVYHTNGNKVKVLPPEHRFLVDVLTFKQAQKMVCGPDGVYLNHVAQFAKQYQNENDIRNLKEEVFMVFE